MTWLSLINAAGQELVGLMGSKAKSCLREDRFSTTPRPIVVLSAKKRQKLGATQANLQPILRESDSCQKLGP